MSFVIHCLNIIMIVMPSYLLLHNMILCKYAELVPRRVNILYLINFVEIVKFSACNTIDADCLISKYQVIR